MAHQTKTRLSPTQMRAVLLANARTLMSAPFQTHSTEISGLKKERPESIEAPVRRRKMS